MRPLGYVEKADGQVQAVVEEDGQIHLVRVGETFADKYKVVAISRDAVQVEGMTVVAESREVFRIPDSGGGRVENRSQESGVRSQENANPSRELRVELGSAAGIQKPEARSQKKAAERRKLKVESQSRENAVGTGAAGWQLVARSGLQSAGEFDCQLPTVGCDLDARDSRFRIPESATQLGYVKRSNGRIETIVADGEHVRLVRGEPKTLARIQDSGLRSQVRFVDSDGPIRVGPRRGESGAGKSDARRKVGVESQELRSESRDLPAQAGSNVESSVSLPNSRSRRQAGPNHRPLAEFGLPDPLEPEELGHFDRNRTPAIGLRDDLHPQAETIADQVTEESGEQGLLGNLESQPPEISDTSDYGPPIPQQIGYIERAMGQVEAIVAVGAEVHFVREGDIFADRFRALSVSPSWVEIEELPLKRRPPPEVHLSFAPIPARISEPKVPTSHSPPREDPTGAKGTNIASGPGPPGERPPPRTQRPPPRAGPMDLDLGPPGGRISLVPMGFAVTGDGETVAFVAVEGEVLLVREGEVLFGHFRVIRVTARAVEILPGALDRQPEVASRSFRSAAGKPNAPVASKDNGPVSPGPATSERIGISRLAARIGSAITPGGSETSRGGLALSEGALHSQAGMLDNPGHRD